MQVSQAKDASTAGELLEEYHRGDRRTDLDKVRALAGAMLLGGQAVVGVTLLDGAPPPPEPEPIVIDEALR